MGDVLNGISLRLFFGNQTNVDESAKLPAALRLRRPTISSNGATIILGTLWWFEELTLCNMMTILKPLAGAENVGPESHRRASEDCLELV